MVNDPVAIGGGGDQPAFRLQDRKIPVGPGDPGKGFQFVLKPAKVFFEAKLELKNLRPAALSAPGTFFGGNQVFERTYEFSGLKSKSLKRRSDQRYAHFSIIGM